MPGPKEEWEIWDRRFQFSYSCLNERLKINEEATQQLDRKTSNLAANSKHLEETNDDLKDGVQKLEQASCHIAELDKRVQDLTASRRSLKEENDVLKDRMLQLDEQVQDLTASGRRLKEENSVLNDRMLQLEREGTQREQENRLAQEQLTEKISAQEQDFRSVIVAMRGMHEIGSAERAQRGEEIQQLRSQVEALVAPRLTPRGNTRGASRRLSQATTEDEDERKPVNQHAKQQQQQQPHTPHADIEVQGMLIKPQAPSTPFEDHLWYADNVFRQHETKAVEVFLGSIQERYRKLLMYKLEERGEWTWQAAREEGHGIIHTEKKAKSRRSARLMTTPSQLS